MLNPKLPRPFHVNPSIKNRWVYGVYSNVLLFVVYILVSGLLVDLICNFSHPTAYTAAWYGTLIATQNDLNAHYKLRKWILLFGIYTLLVGIFLGTTAVDLFSSLPAYSLSTITFSLLALSLIWTSIYSIKYYNIQREYAIALASEQKCKNERLWTKAKAILIRK